MFREIRRKDNEINSEETKTLLKTQRRGVLCLIGDNGYPYGIPVNYLYSEEDRKIYFHSSRRGHKVDALNNNDKVCFTVYGNEMIKRIIHCIMNINF